MHKKCSNDVRKYAYYWMHKETQEEKKTLVDAREHKLEKYNFRM